LIILIAFHDEHLEKGHLLAKTIIQVFESLADSARGNEWLAGTVGSTTLRLVTCEIFEMDASFLGAGFSISASAGASSATRWGAALASAHFVLAKVGLDITADHLVKNGGRDVLKRLTEGRSHLILNLTFEEIVKSLALYQRKLLSLFVQNSNVADPRQQKFKQNLRHGDPFFSRRGRRI